MERITVENGRLLVDGRKFEIMNDEQKEYLNKVLIKTKNENN
jgi:hypothetical protein